MPQDIVSQFDRKYALPIETYRQVNNITNRNNIPDDIRWEGMLVYVVSETKTYYLGPGLEDEDWIDLGSIVNINIQNNLSSTMTTDALSAYMGKVLNETKLNNVTAGVNISIDYTDPLNPIIRSTGGIESVDWGDINGTLSNQSDLQSALDGKENTFFKNTAFNKNFGTTSGTVLQGNWRPSWGDVTGKPTTLSGYGITDAYTKTESDGRYLGLTAKAADSDKLDGLNSDRFVFNGVNSDMRSDSAKWYKVGTFTPNFFNVAEVKIVLNYYDSVRAVLDINLGGGSATNTKNYLKGISIRERVYLKGSDLYIYLPSFHRTAYTISGNGFTQDIQSFSVKPTSLVEQTINTVWTSDNDGSGSGLDADLLDGVQGSNYARTDIGTETFNGSLVANSFKTGNWEIDQTGTTLVFKYNGVAKFNMLSSGIIEATDHKNGLS